MSLSEHRRALHALAETDWDVEQTAQYLEATLRPLSCRVFSPVGRSVCAFFDFQRAKTVAFRAEMDALPILEQTGLPFASRRAGFMHACGHDGHMAILLSLAQTLDALAPEEQPKSNVLLIFQPAEETTGGAAVLCRTGLLRQYRVTRIYGLHLWPDLEKGVVASREGGLMARSCELTAEIQGKSAHIAHWQESHDALYAASLLLQRLYRLAEGQCCVLRFGKMTAGTVRNAVSASARLEGSFRVLSDELYTTLCAQMDALAQDVAKQTGCMVNLTRSDGYPPIQNDAALLRQAAKVFDIQTAEPSFTTEDFSFYQQEVPGVLFWLGTGGEPLHSPHFDFDEAVLDKGLALFLALLAQEDAQ